MRFLVAYFPEQQTNPLATQFMRTGRLALYGGESGR